MTKKSIPTTTTLPEMISFKGVNHYEFRNGVHAEFHRNQYDLVRAVDKAKIGVTDELLKHWLDQINLEDESNRRVGMTVFTKEVRKKDALRNECISTLFRNVHSYKFTPIKAQKEAYEKLYPIINSYRNIQYEGMNEKTAHIRGLEIDLKKQAASMTALHLDEIFTALHDANEAYRELCTKLIDESIDATLPSSRTLRAATDQDLKLVRHHIDLAYFGATDADTKKLILELVNKMDHAATLSKASHRLSKAQRKAAEIEELKKLHKTLQPLYAAFEAKKQWPTGSLQFTEKKLKVNKNICYQLQLKDSDTYVWVRIEKDALVEVELPKRLRNKLMNTAKADTKHAANSSKKASTGTSDQAKDDRKKKAGKTENKAEGGETSTETPGASLGEATVTPKP
ncbi:DUF6261 family protein [Prevotella sp. HJM029]|uniref:DUF6261 family protein n=1 Tax=Prevotella sp. HJM029 TaxID=1433844 RepID=UPI000491966A|nr:DUF6261 family protein [Prevotella sp. HJM029]